MAGHSHWSKIKRAKGANDAKRGKIWSKIARKIIIAAKNGGDPRDNLNLRYTIEEAKAVNMPRDTIEKAIKKGTGELGAENYEDATYEGYAPGGVAIMVEALTNNRSRTAPDMRMIFEKHGGNLATSGSVACPAAGIADVSLGATVTLNVGDWVAVGGLQQLRPGMVVKTDRKPMPSFGQPEGADGQGGEGRPGGKAP